MRWRIQKLYEIFRYDIWHFIRNFLVFSKVLWNYRRWDYSGLLEFIEVATKDMSECHKNHGHLVRSEEAAKELKVVSFLLKRIREDEYYDDKQVFILKDSAILGGEFEQVPNTLPSRKAKSFYKLVEKMKKDDLELACKIMQRKLFTWWD